jgi:hypothetical protein
MSSSFWYAQLMEIAGRPNSTALTIFQQPHGQAEPFDEMKARVETGRTVPIGAHRHRVM